MSLRGWKKRPEPFFTIPAFPLRIGRNSLSSRFSGLIERCLTWYLLPGTGSRLRAVEPLQNVSTDKV
jgi:hypothetical protein